MKKLSLVALIGLIVLNSGVVMAQDPGDLLKGSKEDANYLMKGYASPFLKSVGTGLNQGWYNTAKTHKKFGFDLTISGAFVGVPASEQFFTVNNQKFSNPEFKLTHDHRFNPIAGDGSGKVPTIFGPSTQSRYELAGEPIEGADGLIELRDLPMERLPVPVVNIGFGLPKNIEIKLRYFSSDMIGISSDEINFSMFGVGIMHDVKQYIPGIKLLPFDLSAFVGYTRFTMDSEFDGDDPNKKGKFQVNATTFQALISKKLAVLTVYGGVGYDFSKASLAAKGNYDLDGDGTEETKNPIDLSVTNNGPRATAGMRLKLAVFTFHGDYTFQKYSTFTAGFGISVR
jgi:hypothetical protein